MRPLVQVQPGHTDHIGFAERLRREQKVPVSVPEAHAALARLEDVSATLVLPGHGDPWTGGVQEAVRQVRQSAARRG